MGATWVPMALHVFPLLPNDHPTMAQVLPETFKGCQKKYIFQPTHVAIFRGNGNYAFFTWAITGATPG